MPRRPMSCRIGLVGTTVQAGTCFLAWCSFVESLTMEMQGCLVCSKSCLMQHSLVISGDAGLL